MTTGQWIFCALGYNVFPLTLWFAYKDQTVGINGGLEFPRATRPIGFWLIATICAVAAVAAPILMVWDYVVS